MLLIVDRHKAIKEYLAGLDELLHIDFHCDQRGLVVDLESYTVAFVDGGAPAFGIIDSGNFLTGVLYSGSITRFGWWHSVPGGPLDDQPGTTVLYYTSGSGVYELDVSLAAGRQLDLYFVTSQLPTQGLANVSLDWDFVASIAFDRRSIGWRVDVLKGFLLWLAPENVYFSRSPEWVWRTKHLRTFEQWLKKNF